ncbi:helix-turn-helix transcriptional regulator [Bacillus sp. ISL-37]|uniref:helix-turn-helix domain-containing protein n=1 Tax=Bacillus sp. ISL-37 TaxID=2819123 RepID=UPI001BED37B0|nr:helix-turn-helix transcriptional regulator [Bacillus sp. ISL-37]MBT2682237.1 helix-turn-helix transcriptional regulator [Bacillus sp. ISL-37]
MNKQQTMIVGKVIKELRKKMLLSQEDLADFSQRDRNTISDLERDQYKPSFDTIIRVATVLEMKPSKFVSKIEELEENEEYLNELLREIEEIKIINKKKKRPQ